jgi:hypothetical protein
MESSLLPANRGPVVRQGIYAGQRAEGLFQLLGSAYLNAAKRHGGALTARGNTLAILPKYLAYWRAHPHAIPGQAAADVEVSGEPASYYSQSISWLSTYLPRP